MTQNILSQLPRTPIESPIAIFVDVETLCRKPTAVMPSIGAVAGNLLTGEILDTFYQRIEHRFNAQPGRTYDADTGLFWQNQQTENPEAHRELFDPTLSRSSLEEVLVKFNEWVSTVRTHDDVVDNKVHVVGNGADFDNVIIKNAMEQCDLKPSWLFYENESLRTIVYLGRLLLGVDPKKDIAFRGTKHHALDDARHEFEYAAAVVSHFSQLIKQQAAA